MANPVSVEDESRPGRGLLARDGAHMDVVAVARDEAGGVEGVLVLGQAYLSVR